MVKTFLSLITASGSSSGSICILHFRDIICGFSLAKWRAVIETTKSVYTLCWNLHEMMLLHGLLKNNHPFDGQPVVCCDGITQPPQLSGGRC